MAAELMANKNNLLMNEGAMAEQFVGQELIAYAPRYEEAKLYFWCREKRGSQAEVDYVTVCGIKIIPIEVKAGTTGAMKSLRIFMEEKKITTGVRISQLPLKLEKNVVNLPFYLTSEIGRIMEEQA